MKTILVLAALLLTAPAIAQTDDCAGIVPADLGPTSQAQLHPDPRRGDEHCTYAVADQNGFVAAELLNYGSSTWHVFAPDGTEQGTFNAQHRGLIPQASGFLGVWLDPRAFGSLYINKWDVDGTVLNSTPRGGSYSCGLGAYESSEGGGLGWLYCGNSASSTAGILDRYDSDGNVTGSMRVSSGPVLTAVAGDENGMNLVVYYDGTQFGFGSTDLVGRWYDDTATPVTDAFVIRPALSRRPYNFQARSLIGGGAAVQVDDVWIAAVPSGEAAVQSAPQFLADHPYWDFAIVRGRQAYALVSRQFGGGFENHMPLYSAAGNRCGAVDFPGQGRLDVGADGTVIGGDRATYCTKTWWPALLAGQ